MLQSYICNMEYIGNPVIARTMYCVANVFGCFRTTYV